MDLDIFKYEKPFRLDKNTAWLMERFLIGTSALGVSRYGNDFIDTFRIRNSTQALLLLEELQTAGVSFQFKDTSSEAAQAISQIEINDGEKFPSKELFICTRTESNAATAAIKQMSEYQENKSSKLGKNSNEIVKRRIYELDSVFRHIRNALAHGQLFSYKIDRRASIFMFDSWGADPTAVMAIKMRTFEQWYEILCSYAEREL